MAGSEEPVLWEWFTAGGMARESQAEFTGKTGCKESAHMVKGVDHQEAGY